MLTKDKIKKTIDSLPDHFTIEDVIEELIVIDKIEQGMKDVEEGNVFTNFQVREKLGQVSSDTHRSGQTPSDHGQS